MRDVLLGRSECGGVPAELHRHGEGESHLHQGGLKPIQGQESESEGDNKPNHPTINLTPIRGEEGEEVGAARESIGEYLDTLVASSVASSSDRLLLVDDFSVCQGLLRDFILPKYIAHDLVRRWRVGITWPRLIAGPSGSHLGLTSESGEA